MEGAVMAEATPIGQAKRGPKTEEEQIADARERVKLAVAELGLAVDVAKRFDVPGWNLGEYLVVKMEPMLAKIGFAKPKRLPKARGAKA
jgi:hypothetical protein